MTEGMHGSLPGAPGAKTPVTGNRRNVGILLLEFGSLPEVLAAGPVPNFVKRYLFTGCG